MSRKNSTSVNTIFAACHGVDSEGRRPSKQGEEHEKTNL
jgi:hypothetical protein